MRPSVAYAPSSNGRDRNRHRNDSRTKRWFNSGKWKRLRMKVLARDLFTCQRCGHVEHDTRFLVANHKTPHRGNEILFWDIENLETACKPCHDGVIQSEESRRRYR